MRRGEIAGLALVLLLSAAVRGAYLTERVGAPDFGLPEVDAGYHDDWARTLAFGEESSGDWRRSDRTDPAFATTPYLRPPAFPYMLALVYRLSGGSPLAAIVVQMGLGLGAVFLTWAVGRRWLGTGVGLFAAGLLGTHWAFVYFEGELHATALLVVLELGFLYALGRVGEGGSPRWAAGAGVLLALATLTRPNAAIFLPVALGWLAWVGRRRGADRKWGRPAGLLTLAAALAVLPATVRNWRASGEFVPVTSNLGINLHLGNHPRADGLITAELEGLADFKTCYDYPKVVASLERELGRELSHGEVSRHFRGRALDWVRERPGEALALVWRKLCWLLGPAEVGHNKEVSFERAHSAVLAWLPMSFPTLGALAVLGLGVFALGRRGREDGPAPATRARATREPLREIEVVVLIAALFAAFLLSLLPFFFAARYRVPALPFAILLAGLAVRAGAGGLPGRGRLRILGAASAALALSWLLGPEYSPVGERWHLDRGRAFYRAGQTSLAAGEGDAARAEFEAARREFRAAEAVAPRSAAVHYELALLHHRTGELTEARRAYELVLSGEPDHALAHYNLAFLLRDGGDLQAAARHLRRAAEADPTFAPAPYNQGLVLRRAGRAAAAGRALGEALRRDPSEPVYRNALAHLLATTPDDGVRDGAQALALAQECVRDTQGRRWEFLDTLAAAQAETGRFDEAVATVERALTLAAGDAGVVAELQRALDLYRNRRPFRTPR